MSKKTRHIDWVSNGVGFTMPPTQSKVIPGAIGFAMGTGGLPNTILRESNLYAVKDHLCEVCGQRRAVTVIVVQQLAVNACEACKRKHEAKVKR